MKGAFLYDSGSRIDYLLDVESSSITPSRIVLDADPNNNYSRGRFRWYDKTSNLIILIDSMSVVFVDATTHEISFTWEFSFWDPPYIDLNGATYADGYIYFISGSYIGSTSLVRSAIAEYPVIETVIPAPLGSHFALRIFSYNEEVYIGVTDWIAPKYHTDFLKVIGTSSDLVGEFDSANPIYWLSATANGIYFFEQIDYSVNLMKFDNSGECVLVRTISDTGVPSGSIVESDAGNAYFIYPVDSGNKTMYIVAVALGPTGQDKLIDVIEINSLFLTGRYFSWPDTTPDPYFWTDLINVMQS